MICTSFGSMPFSQAARFIATSEMAELRLDLNGFTPGQIMQLAREPIPIVATCREREGIDPTGIIMQAIRAGVTHIDLDISVKEEEFTAIAQVAKEHSCRIIRSWHNFQCTPSADELCRIAQECSKGADYVKIVTTALCREDCREALSLYGRSELRYLQGRLIAFAMGDEGASTRIDCLALGAPFTYASASSQKTAPGQMDQSEMSMLLYGRAVPRAPSFPDALMPVSKSNVQRILIASALASQEYVPAAQDMCADTLSAMALASAISSKI